MATSAKTLNTLTKGRLADPARAFNTLKGYVDKAAEFTEYELGGFSLSRSMISARELRVAVPSGTTAAQWVELGRAVAYGQAQGVNVIITPVGR